MDTPSLNKVKYLFNRCKTYKEDVKSELNEVFEKTDTFFKIEDTGKKEKGKVRNIDYSIINSRKFLANFTMSNVFNKNNRWATLEIDEGAYLASSGTGTELGMDIIKQVDEVLEENSDTTFKFIQASNYYTEINKSIKDAQVGTGIIKINRMNSTVKPFTFEYQSYDNFYFCEDALGKPIIAFKLHYEMNGEEMIDAFSSFKGFKIPSDTSENDFDKKASVLEVMIGIFDENTGLYKYYHALTDDKVSTKYAEEFLDYPPFIIFRWETVKSSPWGTGPCRDYLDLFKELEDNKAKRAKHRDKIVDPPINYFGNIELMYKANLEAGAINYAGSGIAGDNLGIQPINLSTNLIPLENDIKEEREAVRQAFLAQPLGDITDPVRSATEQSLRIQLFNKEWSGTGELINTEVLYPVFMSCYIILDTMNILSKPEGMEDYLQYSKLSYVNELTKSTGVEEVSNVLNYFNMVGSVVPEQNRQFILKPDAFAGYASEKMRIPNKILYSEEERAQMIAQQEQERQLLIQAQAGGVLGGDNQEI